MEQAHYEAEIARLSGVIREWERDMKGTLATLERERKIKGELAESLTDVTRILKAMRYTVGLGVNQIDRIQKAETLIARAKEA